MDIRRLKYFCSVAKHLNFTKAAEECHIAQTAMSRSIAALENELGFRLFERTHHSVELTPAGAYFFIEAAKIVASFEFAKQSGGEISKTSITRLDIGFGGFDVGFTRFYVGKFMKLVPQCSIVLREYHYDDILESLLTGTSDIIFTSQVRVENMEAVRQELISDSPYVIGAGPSHPLYPYDEVIPEQLNGMNFICPTDVNLSWDQKSHLSTIFNHFGFEPGQITRSNSAISVMTMVELGMGVTFLSDDVEPVNRNIKKIRILDENVATKRHVAAHLLPAKRPIITQFMQFVANTPYEKTIITKCE